MACGDLLTPEQLTAAVPATLTITEFVESDALTLITAGLKTKKTLSGVIAEGADAVSLFESNGDAALGALGGVHIGDYAIDPLITARNQYVTFGLSPTATQWKITDSTSLNYQIDSTTYPDPEDDPSLIMFNDVTREYVNQNFKISIDTVADIVNLPLSIGAKVFWSGYYAVSDGGSNWGVIKSGAHTADGGSIFSIDVNTYVEANIKGRLLNIRKFGAKCDGVSDDLDYINNALNACDGVSIKYSTCAVGGTILIPDNTDLICSNATVRLIDGVFSTGTNHVINGNVVSNVEISGLTVDANTQNQSASLTVPIFFYGSDEITIRKCNILNAYYGIYISSSSDVNIVKNNIYDCVSRGVVVILASTSVTSERINVSKNKINTILGDETASADGAGIVVYGATGATQGDYKNIEGVVVSSNTVYNCATYGIALIAVNDFSVNNNHCYDNTLSTPLNAGIVISEACFDGTTSSNVIKRCLNGIVLDVVTQDGRVFDYGKMVVTGNILSDSNGTGIRVNSQPYTVISNNSVFNSSSYGIFVAKGSNYIISGNIIGFGSNNGIRLAGVDGVAAGNQEGVIISGNQIFGHTTAIGQQGAAIFTGYYKDVTIRDNKLKDNSFDLSVTTGSVNISLIDNEFTSIISIDESSFITKWVDNFRDTATDLYSPELTSDPISSFYQTDGVPLKTFGRDSSRIASYSDVTVPYIEDGYDGQQLSLWNIAGFTITLSDASNVSNIGNSPVALGVYDFVRYVYMNNTWVQSAPSITVLP